MNLPNEKKKKKKSHNTQRFCYIPSIHPNANFFCLFVIICCFIIYLFYFKRARSFLIY